MKATRNKYHLLHPAFVVCLLILVVNDHFLKHAFSNWLTGKLPDVAGIIMLPLLLAFAIPGLRRHAVWISALRFAFWKSPFSQEAIDFYSELAFLQTTRVVDFTDLYVSPFCRFLTSSKKLTLCLSVKSIG